ncbi:uncharacterized protein LOC117337626 isoform X2 [Pecten maximus]|uniref:uncharacterized protein LOC117337626 isoform X1 n=1 Tax=Pecten maximus TaxID=6579 RepID=UPI0014585C39|nr:uncharacterized protein LOC117337626 isoform X1 [Pecten maximus]XP_033754597.1 uncharacterized protein LOC117337626 isoform X2 [Pecten maximus]
MAGSKTVCDFCREGDTEASDLCGKLHIEKITDGKVVAAHHKCMQYSAGLIQYKFDHFGGFKIEKVQAEVKRGRHLRCYLCRNDRKRKNKGKCNRATSGCAVKKCHKSFHYYCAKKSKQCITKRMLVRYKLSDEEKVLYRVFCSPEHESYFKQHKEDLVKSNTSPGTSGTDSDEPSDDDDEEGEDEEDDNDEVEEEEDDAKENELSETIDMDQKDVLMTTLYSPSPRKDNPDLENALGDLEPVDQQNSEDWQPAIVSVESLTHGVKLGDKICTPIKLLSKATTSDDEAQSDPVVMETRSNNSSTIKAGKSNAAVEKSVLSTRKENGIQSKKLTFNEKEGKSEREGKSRNSDRSSQSDCQEFRSPSSQGGGDDTFTTDKHYPDCVVVIPNTLPCDEKMKRKIERQIGTISRVVFWPIVKEGLDLSKEHMPYIMNDIVTCLSDNKSDVVQILTDDNHLKSRLLIHKYALDLHKKLEKMMTEALLEALMKSIEDMIRKINNKDICQLLTAEDGLKALAVFVDNGLDPNNKLRSSLGIEEISSCCLHLLSGRIPHLGSLSVQQQEKESWSLKDWINTCMIDSCVQQPLKVLLFPEETFILDTTVHSVANTVALQLCKGRNDDEPASSNQMTVICIRRMIPGVVNFKKFCHKCIVNYLEIPFTRPVVFVLDIVNGEFENVDDFMPDVEEVKNIYKVDVYTPGPPSETVSSVLLHFYRDCSPRKKCTRKSNAMKSPELTVKNGVPKKRTRDESPGCGSSPSTSSSLSHTCNFRQSPKKKRTA